MRQRSSEGVAEEEVELRQDCCAAAPEAPPFRLDADALRQRVADEITTTFASHYTCEISLAEMLTQSHLEGYAKQATGEKYLVTPNA